MKRVTGIGGIFFKSDDPKKIYDWYGKHLGIKCNEYGTVFEWREKEDKEHICYTVWSAFKKIPPISIQVKNNLCLIIE